MNWRNEKVGDVLNLILGAFLFVSPWIFGFAAGVQSGNAMVCGVIIAALSIATLAAFAMWEEWLNLIVGIWVLVSPWAVGFANTTAAQITFVVGLLVAIIAAVELWMRHRPGHLTPAG
jgi:hypothetical protein